MDKQSKGAKLKKNTSIKADSSDLQWTGFLKFNCQISFRIKPAWRQKFWSTPRQNLSCAVCIFSGWNFAPTLIYSFAHLLCKVLLNFKVFEQIFFDIRRTGRETVQVSCIALDKAWHQASQASHDLTSSTISSNIFLKNCPLVKELNILWAYQSWKNQIFHATFFFQTKFYPSRKVRKLREFEHTNW